LWVVWRTYESLNDTPSGQNEVFPQREKHLKFEKQNTANWVHSLVYSRVNNVQFDLDVKLFYILGLKTMKRENFAKINKSWKTGALVRRNVCTGLPREKHEIPKITNKIKLIYIFLKNNINKLNWSQ
jgi:hypothetical protein